MNCFVHLPLHLFVGPCKSHFHPAVDTLSKLIFSQFITSLKQKQGKKKFHHRHQANRTFISFSCDHRFSRISFYFLRLLKNIEITSQTIFIFIYWDSRNAMSQQSETIATKRRGIARNVPRRLLFESSFTAFNL